MWAAAGAADGADDIGSSTGASNAQPPSKPTKKSAASPRPQTQSRALHARFRAPSLVSSSPIG